MSLTPIYLDHHATTPMDPRVFEAMTPYFISRFGNASSPDHSFGDEAAQAVELARAQVADLIGADPLSVIFTSGATESINLALKGLADYYGESKRHIVTCVTEHPAVADCCAHLESKGFRVTTLGIGSNGHIDLTELEASLAEDTLAISLMFANNEIGTIHDVAAIGALAKRRGVFFHCDGAQAVGKETIDVEAQGIDLLSLSGHKFYGPKGVGALFIRRKNPRVRLISQMHGGGHERRLRSGTLNVPLIVGLGKAAALAKEEMVKEREHLIALRERILKGLASTGYELNGDMERRLIGNLNLRFPGVPSKPLLEALPQLAMSTGSACSSAARAPSRTLRALGHDEQAAGESIRIGLGRFNTLAEMDQAAEWLTKQVSLLRRQGNVDAAVCEL